MNTILLLCSTLLVAAPVEPSARWSGMPADEALKKLAPADGFLADGEALEKVWKGWRPGEEVPKVDFAKDLIVVGVVNGPNNVLMRPALEETGDLKFIVAGTRRGGPGFGYLLLQIPRAGIKTVNGKPLK